MKLIATGKAAHAGNHHRDGANAIWALSQALLRICALSDEIAVTSIRGGQSRNTVPDHAEATLTIPEAWREPARAACASAIDGTTVELIETTS